MRIKIKVTEEILKRTAYCNGDISRSCAISVAVAEIFPIVGVGHSCINVYKTLDDFDRSFPEFSINLPSFATSFILAFDSRTPEDRLEMSPMEFEVEIPEALVEKIGISDVYKILSESRTLELVNPSI